MTNIKVNKIPSKVRSKYFQYSKGTSIIESTNKQSGGLPFNIDENGYYVIDTITKFPSIYVDDINITKDKTITWDNAVNLSHTHNNKSYLDSINQNLSKTSSVEFFGVNNKGVLNMNNNNILNSGNIDFYVYEQDSIIKRNTISNKGLNGFGFNNQISVYGNIELNGNNRDIFSFNDNMGLYRYNSDWTKGSFITLGSNSVKVNNLVIEGSLNCYELIANKVRSTNGMLYVTDSSVIKSVEGLDGVLGVWLIFEEPNFAIGDILQVQKRVDNNWQKVIFRVRNKATKPNEYYCERQMDTDLSLLKAEDYCVKVDSTYNSLKVVNTYNNNDVLEFNSGDYSENDILIHRYRLNGVPKVKRLKIKFKPTPTHEKCNYYVDVNGEWIISTAVDNSLNPKSGENYFKVNNPNNRNTAIFLDPNSGSYIDFYEGWGNGYDKTIRTSLGQLDHLGVTGVSGYGLYSDNAYIRGDIYATNLKFDGLIEGNKIDANSLVVKNLKTSETGVKIEASGHDLKMLDNNNNIKLLITGDSYSNVNSFINSSGAGGNYSINIVNKNYNATSVDGSVSRSDITKLTSTLNIPPTGAYSIVVPSIKLKLYGTFNSMNNGGMSGFGTVNAYLVLYNTANNDIIKTIGNAYCNVNAIDSFSDVQITLNSTEISIKNSSTVALGIKTDFTAFCSAENNEGVIINTTLETVNVGYVTLQELSNNTTIFENGLGYKSSTSKYAMIINEKITTEDTIFQARSGNICFKINSQGVFISENGGTNWRKV